ncbi:NAD(P)-binding protein [Coniochaeta ligniaria NRRL 30616]|uniref:NAD(P)-binding protein n=1 Tax=Coniochaeta ligniaria NRRL 30616 TaxID=1408157 RepID=A0A1J7K4J1_9PEZI|nr:NAD(P)-binding protein [Coniochaeta ligniaria NRRL 30616]
MPVHKGLLPREGFTADVLLRLLGKTALNPALLLPLLLLARLTKRGQALSILHPTAHRRLKTLFYLSLARWLNTHLSRRAINNHVHDTYVWPSEIALVTGGAAGIGAHIAQLLCHHGLTVVVLDIQPLSYPPPPNLHYYTCDITSPATLSRVAATVRSEVGPPTILINNAGVARGKTILSSSERDVRFTFEPPTTTRSSRSRPSRPGWRRRAWSTTAASKAAAQALHEGLAAELVVRYGAPRVRTVLVNQGHVATALFEGYGDESPRFVAPTLEAETVAEAVVGQVLRGESGTVVVPGLLGGVLGGVRGWPLWAQHGLRVRLGGLMVGFRGRQVVGDLDGFYDRREREGREDGAGESAVLVPEVTK